MILDLETATAPRAARVWLGEVPEQARSQVAGTVSTYWRLADGAEDGVALRAAWGYRVGLGGRGCCGLLGAEFTPHSYNHLEVRADVMDAVDVWPDPRLPAAHTGLPHEYVGGVLAGALHEPSLLGAGVLRFRWAAIHDVDSSWEDFRILAVGVVRLLALAPGLTGLPADLLPFFGGPMPDPPGAR